MKVDPVETSRVDRATHGSRRLYDRGCRCFKCSVANSNYLRELAESGPTRVPAKKVTRHIAALERSGWTRSEIAEACDLGSSTVWNITSGNQKGVNRRTATRIMGLAPKSDTPAWLVRLSAEVADRHGAVRDLVLSRSDIDGAVAARHDLIRVLRVAGWSHAAVAYVLHRSEQWMARVPAGEVTNWMRDLARQAPEPPEVVSFGGNDACEDCGGEPMAGGRWCLPCFSRNTMPSRSELDKELVRARNRDRQRASRLKAAAHA